MVSRILLLPDGDTLKRFRDFLSTWWVQAGLEAVLAPAELPDRSGVVPRVIEDPTELTTVNPFAPIMLTNTAGIVGDYLRDHPRSRLALFLRPCEIVTFVELKKRRRIPMLPADSGANSPQVAVVGLDCPGTVSAAEYARRINLVGANGATQEALFYSPSVSTEGALTLEQLRMVCQICESPAPRGADITIGTIGTAPFQHLLVIARDESVDGGWCLEGSTDGLASNEWLAKREMAISAIADSRAVQRAHLANNSARRGGDFGSLMAFLSCCTLCADCLDACPMYHGEFSGMLGVGGSHKPSRPLLSELVEVSRWLASCSGCGMCQEACEHGVLVATLISLLAQSIREPLHYHAGDPSQQLPWIGADSTTT